MIEQAVTLPAPSFAQGRPKSDRALPWLDALKGIALLWIVLNHVVERVGPGVYLGNPTIPWVPFHDRVAQLATVVHAGALTLPATLVRDVGWVGDQGVTLFIILSGFGLTWGLLGSGAAADLSLGSFYRRRLLRIVPMWWVAHLLFAPTGLLWARGLSTGDWRFYASFAGLRFLPDVFYYFSPAWWYVGLLLQLYLVYPFLWKLLRARGPATLLAVSCAIGFIALALGPVLFPNAYFDPWQRGAFFVTRLPEFALGMALAVWWFRDPARATTVLRRPATVAGALAVYVVASGLALTLRGNIVAPVLLGASAFALLFPLAAASLGAVSTALRFVGRHSYAIYLVHHPLVLALVPATADSKIFAVGLLAAGAMTALLSAVLERLTAALEGLFASLAARGPLRPAALAAGIAALVIGLPILADLVVTKRDPQEVNGWGERASLQPDARFGWTLRPSSVTRLRWESYDYTVTANQYGFPGPAFSESKPPNTTRILVLGDAYSSAEGLDTPLSWPRLLQSDLAGAVPGRRFEVLNFAITGYGPNEEAAVASAFVPRFHPDLVLIQYDANDVDDAITSDDAFRASIGFALPPQHGTAAVLELLQLRRWLQLHVFERLIAKIKHKPYAEGYFLGAYPYLERGHPEWDGTGTAIMTQRYREIAAVARRNGARTMVAFIPTPAQSCDPPGLHYYPKVNIYDPSRYDVKLPLERVERATRAASIPLIPLDEILGNTPVCAYQPNNMHLTAYGNRVVADALAKRLKAIR